MTNPLRRCGHPLGSTRWCPDCELQEARKTGEFVVRRPRAYGYSDKGELIVAPPGWRILPEGEPVPQLHREWMDPQWGAGWCAPRPQHSTMTSITACVRGAVRAIAVPAA